MSYPSVKYAAPSARERGLMFIGGGLPMFFASATIWMLSVGEPLGTALAFLARGTLACLPILAAALVLRARRMKRVTERADFLASVEMVCNG